MTYRISYAGPNGETTEGTAATWQDAVDLLSGAVDMLAPDAERATFARMIAEAKPESPLSLAGAAHRFGIHPLTEFLPALVAPYSAVIAPHPTEHSELGASIAKRFIACPGSVRMCRLVPPAPTTPAAERGTAMHEVAALCLTNGQDAIEYVGRMVNGLEFDDVMAEDVQLYLDHCYTRPNGGEGWVEYRFTLDALNPPVPMFGTADHVVYKDGALYVDDLKTGWLDVAADDNVQLRYYALGAMLNVLPRPVTKAVAAIVQPKRGGVKPVEFDVFELMEWSGELLAHARATQEPDAPCIAGPHCRDTFCPAAGTCAAHAAYALEVAGAEFPDVADFGPPRPETLTVADRVRILNRAAEFEGWIQSVRDYTKARIQEGEEHPDWKVVVTEGRETWRDADTVITRLVAAAPADLAVTPAHLSAPPKPLSPAQSRGVLAERIKAAADMDGMKLTKKAAEAKAREILAPFVHRPNTGIALVPATDSRPALAGAGSEFPALPAEES